MSLVEIHTSINVELVFPFLVYFASLQIHSALFSFFRLLLLVRVSFGYYDTLAM